MTRPKIVADSHIPFLSGRIPGADVVAVADSDITPALVRDADALLIRTRTRCGEPLLKDSKVRLIATATIGTDQIDLPWCAENGIVARNSPGCNAPGVALYVWASLLRQGFDPKGKTVAVVGCGNVGSIVAQWGRRLGARIIVSDPPRQEAGHSDWEYLPLEEVLSQADAVTFHTPLIRNGAHPTFHLMGEEQFSQLKRGAYFVNASRGEVVETRALCRAIREGRISKAVIDTWEGEPHIDRELLGLADVATFHIAGYSVEGKQRATRMVLESVRDVLGLDVDLNGLEGPYVEPADLSPARIAAAFNPQPLTEILREKPDDFERLRNSYPLHQELK